MKKIFLGVLPLLFNLLFFGCSSSSDKTGETIVDEINDTTPTEENTTQPEDNTSVEPIVEQKNISIPSCESGDYERLQSGDKIIKVSDEPQVEIIHNQDNKKSICLQSGEAEIERLEN
jgi:hypothetical protein